MSHEGKRNREIASTLTISEPMISHVRKKFIEHGIEALTTVQNQQLIPESVVREASILRGEGKTLRQIGEQLGVSYESVRQHLAGRDADEGRSR